MSVSEKIRGHQIPDDHKKVNLGSATRSFGDAFFEDVTADTVTATTQTITTENVTTLNVSGTATFSGATAGLRDQITITSADTLPLTAAMSGSVILCTKTSATQTFTLPATVAGLKYTFVAMHADGEINIDPVAADKITGKGIAGGDNGNIKNTAGSNAVGDALTLVGDGVDGWVVVSMLGTWEVV